ncbi:MAG TPA: BppU family phage baseplate upper protein [Candidatus Limiplasma sp.]|nr:BppU family phage baseplate upper protein [Candidatus Limiplasma sp.]HPR77002.1 BppU family phage baseplate upper protein [Candidatus Limiplasma sp.]
MLIPRRLSLDIGKPGQQDALYARKGDTRIYCLLIDLRDGAEEVTVPADAQVILTGTKPDGTVFTLNGLPQEGRAKAYLSAQALTVAGIVTCDLRIVSSDGSDLYSPSFDLIVENCVLPEDALESSSDFDALTTLYRQIRGMVERTTLTVIGVPYATVEALHEAVPEPYPWSVYAVGAAAPYDLYRYVGDESAGPYGWVNHGPIAGIVGPVYLPAVDNHGVISFTNNGGLENPAPVDLASIVATLGNFLKYDAVMTLSDVYKANVLTSIGALGVLPQDYTDAQRRTARNNIRIYTDPADLGLTVTITTTMEEVLNALPDGATLVFMPASTTTSNLIPSVSKYGTLIIHRISTARTTIIWYPVNGTQYRCYATYNSGGWTLGSWIKVIDANDIENDQAGTDATKVLAAPVGKVLGDEIDAINARTSGATIWSGTAVVQGGTATAPEFATANQFACYFAGSGLMEIQMANRDGSMCGVAASPITGGIRLYTLKATRSGTTITFDSMSRIDVMGGAVSSALTTAGFTISVIRQLS